MNPQVDYPVEAAFASWLRRFGRALEHQATDDVIDLFVDDGYWKDILSFTWAYRTYGGKADIGRGLKATLAETRPRNLRPAAGRTAPRLARRSALDVIEAYFDFDTVDGRGTGFVRLLVEPDRSDADLRAWIVLTTLQELSDFPPLMGEHRPTGLDYSLTFAGDNWADKRRSAHERAGDAPEVMVVGAGQAGLALAARLGQLGVRTLLIEKNARVGDNWRNRYHSLTLHNEVWSNHLPYLNFPETWPAFVPKDKLAGWLEAYVEFMELDVWTSTEFQTGTYDEESGTWITRMRRSDGTAVEIRPKHLVLATGGTSGVRNMPSLPGLDSFEGEVMHSSDFSSGIDFTGRRALVVGTGTSGHDVAQDLSCNGVDVTLVQRSPTCVVSLKPSGTMVYAVYSEGPPADDVDLVTAAIPYPVLQNSYQWLTRKTNELDADLLDALTARGFRLDSGTDATGFHMMFLRRGGGYYINVGASNLVASGDIGLIQDEDYDTFTARGIRMADGSEQPFDLVVLATGYRNQQEGIRAALGDEVADRVGRVWGFDENYVMRNLWQRTAQPHLWLAGGSLLDCRLYSRFLALLIRADLAGLARPETVVPSTAWDSTGATTILDHA
jgi:hypothetical protein